MRRKWPQRLARNAAYRGKRPNARMARPAAHRVGTGPDSLYLHAVRPGPVPASGPVALCGYPLRRRTDHEVSFEEAWESDSGACRQCAEYLGLGARQRPTVSAPGTDTTSPLFKWATLLMFGSMLAAALLRLVVAMLR